MLGVHTALVRAERMLLVRVRGYLPPHNFTGRLMKKLLQSTRRFGYPHKVEQEKRHCKALQILIFRLKLVAETSIKAGILR
jgi:hypothetical protein